MSVAPRPKWISPEEYLAIEEKATFKSEYYDGVMYPLHETGLYGMAGASGPHNTINENLSVGLGGRLLGGPCRTYSRDVKVQVSDTGMYAYPDVMIVCGRPEMDKEKGLILNPKVVIEVLSPSTENYDRSGKFAHYKRVTSVVEYLLVSQDQAVIDRFTRQLDGTWKLWTFEGLAGDLKLEAVAVSMPMAEVYRDVEFPDWLPLK